MIKSVCDACGKDGANNKFEYLCHLDDAAKGQSNLNGYVDNDGNAVSCRTVHVDLCNACYNKIVTPAVVALKEMQAFTALSAKHKEACDEARSTGYLAKGS